MTVFLPTDLPDEELVSALAPALGGLYHGPARLPAPGAARRRC